MGHERSTLKADAFLKLEERLGRKAAAEAMGITTGCWTPANLIEGTVTQPFELAARHILSELDPAQTLLVHCPKDKANLLEIFCRGLGVSAVNITSAQEVRD